MLSGDSSRGDRPTWVAAKGVAPPEESNLKAGRIFLQFPGRLLTGFFRRVFWRYLFYDVSPIALFLIFGIALFLFGRKDEAVLDFGVGTGVLLPSLHRYAARVAATDIRLEGARALAIDRSLRRQWVRIRQRRLPPTPFPRAFVIVRYEASPATRGT